MAENESLQPILVACPDCDLLNQLPELAPDESASCVRCEAVLSRNPKNSIARSMALTWTAIILFAVANAFPFLSFGKDGIVTHTTLITGVVRLYHEGMYFLAVAVSFTTIVVPVIILAGSCYLLLPLRFDRKLPGAELVFRSLLKLQPWNMVEIFLIGIIVAAVKLHKMADLVPGLSAWAFLILVLVLTWTHANLEPRVLWEKLETTR
jgi:paraquat-inducible protein A